MRLAVAECGQQWPAVVSLDIVARCGQGLPPTALCASKVVTCRGQLRVAVAHAVSGHQLGQLWTLMIGCNGLPPAVLCAPNVVTHCGRLQVAEVMQLAMVAAVGCGRLSSAVVNCG